MINRGTFVRRFGIERILHNFIDKYGTNAQVISLGAGSDTFYFNLQKPIGMYCEIDFEHITTTKTLKIVKNKLIPNITRVIGGSQIESPHYMLLSGDLADFEKILENKSSKLDFNKPTLVLSECVLIYMETMQGNRIINLITIKFPKACFLTFEQILPHDRYGQVMIQNLAVSL